MTLKLTPWTVAAGALVLAIAYYAFKPVSKVTFYDPEIMTAMAGANAAGVANATSAQASSSPSSLGVTGLPVLDIGDPNANPTF